MGAMGLGLSLSRYMTAHLIRICKCRLRIGTLLIHAIKVQWVSFLFVGRHVYHNLVHGLGKCVCAYVCVWECVCVCVSTLVTTPIRIPLLLTIHLLCPTNIFNAIFALISLLFSPANNNNYTMGENKLISLLLFDSCTQHSKYSLTIRSQHWTT